MTASCCVWPFCTTCSCGRTCTHDQFGQLLVAVRRPLLDPGKQRLVFRGAGRDLLPAAVRNAPADLQQEQALGGIHAVDSRAPLILDDGLVIFFGVAPEHGKRHSAFAQRRPVALHAVAAQPGHQRHHVAEEEDRLGGGRRLGLGRLGGSAPRTEAEITAKRPSTARDMAFVFIGMHPQYLGNRPGFPLVLPDTVLCACRPKARRSGVSSCGVKQGGRKLG